MEKLKSRQKDNFHKKWTNKSIILGSLPPEKRKLLFSFQYINSEYCVSCYEKNDRAAFANQLRMLGSKTWAELHQATKHGLGYEKIEKKLLT